MTGRIFILLLIVLLGLTACSDQVRQTALQRLTGPTPGVQSEEVQRLVAADAPILIVRLLDRGTASSLLLAAERDRVQRWRALDNVQIYTRDGLIIGTRGLSFDLMTSDPGPAAAIIAAGQAGEVPRIDRLMDGNDRLQIRSYVCDIVPVGPEEIRTGERETTSTLRTDETCYNPRGNVLNRYWVSAGRILQAEQTFSPDIGRVQILFLP